MSLVNLEAINMIPQMMEKIDFLNMEIMKIKNRIVQFQLNRCQLGV